MITTNCTDNILWLVDSWDFKLSIDHHLWTVRPVVKDLSMLKTKCWWIFKLWHNYLCHKTWELQLIPRAMAKIVETLQRAQSATCRTGLHFDEQILDVLWSPCHGCSWRWYFCRRSSPERSVQLDGEGRQECLLWCTGLATFLEYISYGFRMHSHGEASAHNLRT